MPNDNPEEKKNKGPEPLPLKHKKMRNPFGKTGKKNRLLPKALQLYEKQWSYASISDELGIHVTTLRRWLREAGAPPKKNGWQKNETPWIDPNDVTPESIFDGDESRKTHHSVVEASEKAHQNEAQRIVDIAKGQGGPAEAYQSYMASQAVRLMRNGMETMKPPTNVREAEVLDRIARRHFGLDEKQGGSIGSLSIDVSILNDVAATARKRPTKQTVDIEVEP